MAVERCTGLRRRIASPFPLLQHRVQPFLGTGQPHKGQGAARALHPPGISESKGCVQLERGKGLGWEALRQRPATIQL